MKLKNFDIALLPITFRGTFDPPDTRGSHRAVRNYPLSTLFLRRSAYDDDKHETVRQQQKASNQKRAVFKQLSIIYVVLFNISSVPASFFFNSHVCPGGMSTKLKRVSQLSGFVPAAFTSGVFIWPE